MSTNYYMAARKLKDKNEKLDSLLTLISHALTKDGDGIESEEIKNCVNIAWDINHEICVGLCEIASTKDE
ncbi:hypothetical protein HP437_22425 [Serratia marcescens]|uniref:hypothetical protein n=1 Tax=Serratia marcescens TaxID=615 RepID=UPI0015D6FA59|nr:hypothetical protein [Serratia marcescens]QLJ67768.1 hypothetical protein HP437_22425 [Serratia marcescens]